MYLHRGFCDGKAAAAQACKKRFFIWAVYDRAGRTFFLARLARRGRRLPQRQRRCRCSVPPAAPCKGPAVASSLCRTPMEGDASSDPRAVSSAAWAGLSCRRVIHRRGSACYAALEGVIGQRVSHTKGREVSSDPAYECLSLRLLPPKGQPVDHDVVAGVDKRACSGYQPFWSYRIRLLD